VPGLVDTRWGAAVQQCKTLIAQGSVGDLRVVQLHEETPFQPGHWRRRRDLNGGGVFIDLAVVLKAYESMAQGVSLAL
jgi:predicted dehydrogenase